jgi:hypothetical protein
LTEKGQYLWRKEMDERTKAIPALVIVPSLIGGAGTLLGTYWDDAWHTDRGRDSFFIPPHLLLYTGILVIGLSAVLWALTIFYRERSWRALFRWSPLLLALIGDVVTLAAAPIDNAWHLAFGRDAVLWSPPHLLAVVGMLAVGTGLLLGRPFLAGWRGYLLTSVLATLIVGTVFIPVMEYEADVPQFASLWYLPVLTVGFVFALSILSTVDERPWIATTTTLVYMAIRIGVVAFLWFAGFSLPLIPPLLLPALVFDLMRRFRWSLLIQAGLITLTVYISFVPYLNFVLHGITISLADTLIGFPLAILGSWCVLILLTSPHPQWRTLRGIIVCLLLMGILFLSPGQALAHDPGQGKEIGTVQMHAVIQQSSVALTGTVKNETLCHQLLPRTIEARRAGKTVTDHLSWRGACQFQGTLLVSGRGRWFVYAEWLWHQQPVETWLPVEVSGTQAHFGKDASLYLRETTSGSPGEMWSGIILYTIMLILFCSIIWTVRRFSANRIRCLEKRGAL